MARGTYAFSFFTLSLRSDRERVVGVHVWSDNDLAGG